ncbi:protein fuzzy homolog isoform X1 [Poecile atricapillus]|uniref:protein fuzzy homolog isoform X1 n=1 Tax=Poecile atricapillus TaxID=48891 RepID=UPI002738E093|nr:protein fuzzy homolog isoform X1 [Poecile atricapillus]
MPEEEEGAPCLLCLATASGLPLFCRPPRPQLPFSLVGALHGVHLFGAMEGAELRQAATPTAHVTWGTYGNSISLILLSPSPAPARILDSAFGAMVLVLGLDELVPVRNVERLKRDLRSCFGLIDALLTPRGGWGLGPPCRPLPPATPREALQDRLQRFGGAAHTDLCCLCFGSGGFGGSVLGTPRWGALSGADSAPLRALMMTSSWGGGANGRGPAARDLPVFLPNSSPQVPHRLLLLRLLPGLLLALLCGPRPSLQLLLAQLLPQFWGPLLEQLRGCARPRPPPMPPEVLGYLLIHRGQTHSGISKGAGQGGSLPPHLRAAALRNLQKLLAPQYRPELGGRGSPPGLRLCYVSLPTHTGCCLLRPELLLLLLLPPGTPRDPLNPTAMRVLSALSCG